MFGWFEKKEKLPEWQLSVDCWYENKEPRLLYILKRHAHGDYYRNEGTFYSEEEALKAYNVLKQYPKYLD